MNITGKFLKVWKVKENNGYTKLDLGDSKKQKDGTYQNWTWFDCLLVGNAKNVTVNENDTVEIKSGMISQEKYKDKWYNRIVIFELGTVASAGGGHDQEYSPKTDPNHNKQESYSSGNGAGGNFEEDIPF